MVSVFVKGDIQIYKEHILSFHVYKGSVYIGEYTSLKLAKTAAKNA